LDFYEKKNVDTFLGTKATRIDVDAKEVERKIGYGKLLIATGGKPFIPPMEGLSNQENVFTFLSLDDVLSVEKAMKEANNVVILGGGIIGLMAAEVLKKKGLDVKVVELADRVLAPVVDDITSKLVQDKFAEKGVEIILENTISKVVGKKRVDKVILRDGRVFETDMLIVAVGVIPNTELARDTPIKVNRGIVVNRKMETSVKDIYACGDCAEIYDFIFGANRVLPLWPTAYIGGRIAGFNMCGVEREYNFATAMNAMHFFDYYIINAGLNIPNDSEEFEILNRLEGENYRKFAIKDGKIAGLIIAGKVDRAGIFLRLMREGVDVTDFKEKLLKDDFSYLDIPESVRWELLEGDVKLGVVYEL
jgi:NAD(P)H-nitrite reductase large subunit